MKKLKILTSVLLALVLCLSFVLPSTVNAVNSITGSVDKDQKACSITISGQLTGHKFVAYRIFKADLNVSDGAKVLSNIEFDNSNADEKAWLLSELNSTFGTSYESAADIAEYLSDLPAEDKAEAAVKFATAAYGYMATVTSYELKESTSDGNVVYVTESPIEPGYYLIIDENDDDTNRPEDVYSRFILEVSGDIEATAKIVGYPELDKIVGKMTKENVPNYTSDMNDTKGHHNTANIGDTVPFKIEVNFPQLAQYSSYKFEVLDTLSEGFTFNNDLTMKIVTRSEVDGVVTDTAYVTELVKDTDYTYVVNSNEITINFSTIYNRYEADHNLVGKMIIIEYTANLNENAKVNYKEPNTNTAKLTFTNNPRTNTEGTTPEVTTETYTFNVTINKVDFKNRNTEFEDKTEPTGYHVPTLGGLSNTIFELYKITSEPEAETEITERITRLDQIITNDYGQFVLEGLENGRYYLVETKAHDGYNTVLGRIKFTVDAGYNDTTKGVEMNITDDSASTPGDAKNTVTLGIVPNGGAANELYLLITNSTGAQLPSTGGIGTVIFTVVGLLVMATVAVIAVKSNKESK